MKYSEKLVKQWAKEIINCAKQSTTCSYIISYGNVDSFDPTDKECQRDILEWLWDYNNLNDNLRDIDFNDTNQFIIVLWYEPPMKEEETEMKKYELKDYKEFCREALECPPFEEFEEGTIDEEEWYRQHDIKISTGNHEINIGYGADEVNEIEYALREIHEAVLGSGEATTGNTVGSQYRPAELKDIVRFFVLRACENWGNLDWIDYAERAVKELSNMQAFSEVWKNALDTRKAWVDILKCNFEKFDPATLKDATEEGIKKIILELVGSNVEVSYDPHTDKSFLIDYTFSESGIFIDWSWGQVNEDEIQNMIAICKESIF